jgi:hypothetical protein
MQEESGDALVVRVPVLHERRGSWSNLGLQRSIDYGGQSSALAPVASDALVQPGASPSFLHTHHGAAEAWVLQKEAGVPGYTVLELLGEGSFAECVRMREVESGRTFAGKLCPKRQLTAAQRKKLARLSEETKLGLLGVAAEIEIHSSLLHHNIVHFQEHFFDQASGKLCMVLEHCAHGTLRRVLQRVPGKVLPPTAVQTWMLMLMDALSYMHGCGIAHRDINPDNLLVDQSLALKLCDFGFATRVTAAGQNADAAAAAEAVGTLSYIAPEVLLRDGLAGGGCDLRAADVWAAGVVMYEALLGHVPFLLEEEEEPGVDVLHPVDSPAPLSMEAVDFIAATLHRSPDCRPTASALLEHAFFGGSFCAFPGTKGEILMRAQAAAAAAAAHEGPEAATAAALAEQQDLVRDMVLALPPSPPRREAELTMVVPSTSASSPPPFVAATATATSFAAEAPALMRLPVPVRHIPSEPVSIPGVPAGVEMVAGTAPAGAAAAAATAPTLQRLSPPRDQRTMSISPSSRRALAISPARCSREPRNVAALYGGGSATADIGIGVDDGAGTAAGMAAAASAAAAVANHQVLASGMLHTLGVPTMLSHMKRAASVPAGTTAAAGGVAAAGAGSASARSASGVDEDLLSWVLLLQLDPLLDARWIQAAHRHLLHAAASRRASDGAAGGGAIEPPAAVAGAGGAQQWAAGARRPRQIQIGDAADHSSSSSSSCPISGKRRAAAEEGGKEEEDDQEQQKDDDDEDDGDDDDDVSDMMLFSMAA